MPDSTNIPPVWKLEFSALDVTVHAWGPRVVDEFGASNARLFVLLHENGAAFIVVVGKDSHDVLLLNFGQFWLISTCSRWTASTVTYRARSAGIYLIFSTAASLDRFEECCDRVLPANILTSVVPLVEDLYDLGIVPPPRVVGDFLLGSSGFALGLSTTSGVASESDTDSEVSSDDGSELSTPTTLVDLGSSVSSLDSVEIDELSSVMLEEAEFANVMLEDGGIFWSAPDVDYVWFD